MTDEILVHISAAATRQNDDLYLSLAEAYQEFEPHNTFGDESEQNLVDAAVKGVSDGSDAARSSILSTSKESYGSFPSLLSFDGPTNVLRSVNMISRLARVEDNSVPTSSRLARLDKIHQHWKKQTTPRSSFTGQPTSSGRTPQSSPEHAHATFADSTFIEDTQLGAEALQSQLQDDWSATSEDTSEDEQDSTLLGPPAPPLEDMGSRLTETVDHMRRSEPERSIIPTASSNQLGTPRLDDIPKTSLPVVHPSPKKRQVSSNKADSPKVYDFRRLPIEVYPPPPKISIERPGKLPSQITKHLAAIKAQNPKRFRSVRKAEKPRVDDRGFWSVSCSTWPIKTQHDFWSALSEHVLSGRLGWGVTLHREGSSQTLGTVKLYCWAELIEHTWLLLWLSSHGEVAKSGSSWMNADSKVVYEVQ